MIINLDDGRRKCHNFKLSCAQDEVVEWKISWFLTKGSKIEKLKSLADLAYDLSKFPSL